MSHDNTTLYQEALWPREKVVIYFIIVVVMTIVGVVGNALVLATPFCDKKLKVPANVFIINLAIADMVVSAVTNPFSLVALVHGESWFLERWLFCEVIGDMCMTACTASLANIFMIALNRYVAVCYHQHYARMYTWRRTLAMAALVWLFSTVVVVPTNHLGWVGNVFDRRYMICILDQHKDYAYNYLWVFVLVAAPVAVIAVFYTRVFLAITRQKRAVTQQSGAHVSRDDRRLAKTLFITYVIFVGCWLPYAASLLTDIELVWDPHVYVFVLIFAHGSSSGVNSIVYAATNKNFRAAYIKALSLVCPCVGVKVAQQTNTVTVGSTIFSLGPIAVTRNVKAVSHK